MKKVTVTALLLTLAFSLSAQVGSGFKGRGGSGSSSLDLDTLLPIIADSSKWADGSTVNAIKPRGAKTVEADSVKAGALEVTGNSRFNGNVTLVTTASESLIVPAGGIRNEGGMLQKGAATFGKTGTQATIATTGKITTPDTLVSTLGIRTEGTARIKGTATFGATATAATIATTGKITSPDTLVSTKGIRTEGPATIKGNIDARTKAVIGDSLRVNKTSKLIGNVEVGIGTGWFTAEDSLLAVVGDISLDGFKVSKIDTVFTATYVPRWVKYTSGAKSWYCPVYADTTGKW